MSRALPKYSKGIGGPKSLMFNLLAGSALAAFAAHTLKFAMPERGKIIGVRFNAGLLGGTHSTSTLDVKAGSSSVLAAAFNVATAVAGTPIDKEVADLSATGLAAIEANTEMSIVTAESGGTNPTWADVTVQIEYVPLGG